jgi:hypothetical protein
MTEGYYTMTLSGCTNGPASQDVYDDEPEELAAD